MSSPTRRRTAAARTGADGRVLQGGQAKAYRPLPVAEREAALRSALDAYRRGDYFLAHELLEPAWMGTADPAERDLYQGLIKLSAGFVHAVRGNPAGVAANLRGARARLASTVAVGGPDAGLDLAALVAAVDERIAIAEGLAAASPAARPRRPGEPARPPVPLEPPAIPRAVR